jgi:hypothetical protein
MFGSYGSVAENSILVGYYTVSLGKQIFSDVSKDRSTFTFRDKRALKSFETPATIYPTTQDFKHQNNL